MKHENIIISKKIEQLKEPKLHIVNYLVDGSWHTISQEKVGKMWRTELNGKLITNGCHDALPKKEGQKLAMEKIKETIH